MPAHLRSTSRTGSHFGVINRKWFGIPRKTTKCLRCTIERTSYGSFLTVRFLVYYDESRAEYAFESLHSKRSPDSQRNEKSCVSIMGINSSANTWKCFLLRQALQVWFIPHGELLWSIEGAGTERIRSHADNEGSGTWKGPALRRTRRWSPGSTDRCVIDCELTKKKAGKLLSLLLPLLVWSPLNGIELNGESQVCCVVLRSSCSGNCWLLPCVQSEMTSFLTGFTRVMIDQGEEHYWNQEDAWINRQGLLNASNVKSVFATLVSQAIRDLDLE